jgi:uncharacterized membrane protein YedE/YeeE
MTFPLGSVAVDHGLAILSAVVLGFAFGFVLERVGFGRAPKLVAQFHGTDMTVLKVIFSAIVTAMLGVVVLSGLRVLDLPAVAARYPTFLGPMIAGGLLLGVGFVVAGYCPGTSVVAMASGKLDGALTVVGVAVGSVAYSELQAAVPALARFHDASGLGALSLAQLLHLPTAVVAALVVMVAIAAFVGAEWVERAATGREVPGAGARRVVFAAFALLAFAGVATLLMAPPAAAQPCARGAVASAECVRGGGR